MANIFQDSTKSIPMKDNQIVRVSMDEEEIGGRKSHLPKEGKSPTMAIDHVPNAGSKA
jgi:hypothetical protein